MPTMNQNRPLHGTDANGKEQSRVVRKPYQEDAFKGGADSMRSGSDDLRPGANNSYPHPPLNTTKPPYSRRPSDPVHAPHRDAYTAQHNEALRMALGSILSPKRPFTPSSTSHPASGTASPAFFHALPFTGTGPSTGPNTGAQTPSDAMNGSTHPQQHAHTHHLYPHWPGSYHHPHPPEPRQYHSDPHHPYHPHTPSRLGAGEEGPAERAHAAHADDLHDPSHPPSPGELATLPAVDNLHAPAPVAVASASPHSVPSGGAHPAHAGDGSPSSGAGTPRAKFLDTLQGKSAWDALIHGSFS
ncbi:uncharacterized protein SCHCODRAFT_02075621 [Schizophyllum commune H4-8]|uniref:Uncharacterized protein n=1 Tax=Schizophyllum commune (strain H4-8 / FGSC 9210) TaxID=578458 RepID=D8QG76_SCHCM|nr:uncharacterized protein SCHCODRAFT_02075621 [Schizophyllum commune H4-8]KAI5887940.1 hypothetical protein SCHCODRAFT_02075621 [Schizophyllum commune H4-8]